MWLNCRLSKIYYCLQYCSCRILPTSMCFIFPLKQAQSYYEKKKKIVKHNTPYSFDFQKFMTLVYLGFCRFVSIRQIIESQRSTINTHCKGRDIYGRGQIWTDKHGRRFSYESITKRRLTKGDRFQVLHVVPGCHPRSWNVNIKLKSSDW